MIQKAAATGTLWLAASSWQCACSYVMSHAEFFCKTSNHPGDSAPPPQPRFGTLQLLTFPKTKITFKREEIPDHQWYSGKYNSADDGDWENCTRSQGVYKVSTLKGTEVSLFYVQCFLYLLKERSLFFILHDWIYSGKTFIYTEVELLDHMAVPFLMF